MVEAPDMVQFLFQYLRIDRAQFCQLASNYMPEGAEQEPTQIPISMQLEQEIGRAHV